MTHLITWTALKRGHKSVTMLSFIAAARQCVIRQVLPLKTRLRACQLNMEKIGCLQWRSDFQQGFEAYCSFQLSRVLEIFPRVQLFAFNTKGHELWPHAMEALRAASWWRSAQNMVSDRFACPPRLPESNIHMRNPHHEDLLSSPRPRCFQPEARRPTLVHEVV